MDIIGKSAAQLGDGIEDGSIDPVELAQACLEQVDQSEVGERIFARTTGQRALSEAKAAYKRAKEGIRLHRLDGVPVSWKDLFDTAGIATESGSRLLEGRVPEEDCEVLKRATDAGCVCLGKTHLSELAFSGLGVNPKTATAPNRLNKNWAPGGSSSGAAASIAYDMVPLAIGSDTGGSVRIPAAWNNLVGLKTTAGLLPNDGVVPLCTSFDTAGPLARNVEDASLMFEVLSGRKIALESGPDVSQLRLLICDTLVFDGCDERQLSAFETSIGNLTGAGVTIENMNIPQVEKATALGPTLFPFEAYQEWGATIEADPDKMFEPVRNRFYGGKSVSKNQYDEAWAQLLDHRRSFSALTNEFDGLILPTTPLMPPEVDKLMSDLDYFWDANLVALRNTRVGNLLGLSSLTLPTGTDACGFMIFTGPNCEEKLLQLGRALEGVFQN